MTNETSNNQWLTEIEELANLPEAKEFFINALKEFKEKFEDIIPDPKKSKPTAKPQADKFVEGWQKGKSYFFEVNRKPKNSPDSESDYEWELVKFKLKDQEEIKSMVFTPEFYDRVNKARIAPHQTQNFAFKATESGKNFELDLMKNSVSRVVGFVKEVGIVEDKVISRSNDHQLTLAGKYKGITKEEMYQKLHQLMEENPDIREDIFFYFLILQESRTKND